MVFFLIIVHLFRLTNSIDDILDMVDIDGNNAICLQFIKQFSYSLFNIIRYFIATYLSFKVIVQRVHIVFQQFVSIFIYIEKSSAQIDVYILFHDLSSLVFIH